MFWIFSLVLMYLPLVQSFLNFEVGIVTLNLYVVGVTAVALVGGLSWAVGRRPGFIGLHDVPIALLAITYLVSTLLAKDMVDAGFLAFHALFVPIMTYFAARAAIRTESQYVLTIRLFVISVFMFSVYYLFVFASQEERRLVLGIPPIGVATLLAVALLQLINFRDKKLYWLIGAVIFAAFLLTFSRVYLLVILLSPIILKWVRKGYSVFVMVGFILVTLVATIVFSVSAEAFRPEQYDKALEFTSARLFDVNFLLGSLYGRAVSYRDGIDLFLEAPVFGHGLFTGQYMVTQHNFHIEWLQYGGVIGYLLYASVLVVHSARMTKLAQHDIWVSVNMTAIFAILSNCVMNGIMHGLMPYVIFLLMGMNESRRRFTSSVPDDKMQTEKQIPGSKRVLYMRPVKAPERGM